MMDHPEVAFRDCPHCLEFQYDEAKGGRLVIVGGKPMRRPAGVRPLCQMPGGCPKGTPQESNALSPRNEQAYSHYRRCVATGSFPDADDPIVARNAEVIRAIEDDRQRSATSGLRSDIQRLTRTIRSMMERMG